MMTQCLLVFHDGVLVVVALVKQHLISNSVVVLEIGGRGGDGGRGRGGGPGEEGDGGGGGGGDMSLT